MLLRGSNTRNLYLRLPFFENEGVPNNASESAFQFIMRNSTKCRKIEILDASYMVKIRRFKMFEY